MDKNHRNQQIRWAYKSCNYEKMNELADEAGLTKEQLRVICKGVKRLPKWLYRLESTKADNGLWYDYYGNYVFGINEAPNCETKHLPMGYDERYKMEGLNWFSSCSKIEDLSHWYSFENAKWLLDHGFAMRKYLATRYDEYEKETVFLKSSCLDRVDLTLEEVFGEVSYAL